MEIPVYLFTGFLESGKTKMIQETLEDPDFNDGERFLLVVCEEGIEEFDPSRFPNPNVFLKVVDSAADLSMADFSSWEKEYDVDRVLIEYNGMWTLDPLYQNLPENWSVCQEMMFADAATIQSYNTNLRSLVVDKLSSCGMIIFNRVTEDCDRMELHKLVRGVSRNAAIAYETVDGEVVYDDIEDPLPFDLEAPVVVIADGDYALFYRDLAEDMNKYAGKTLRFKGIVATDASLPKNTAMVGRYVMVCCAEDITYRGLAMKGPAPLNVKTRDWVMVEGMIQIESHELYQGQGPVLYVSSVTPAPKADPEVAMF